MKFVILLICLILQVLIGENIRKNKFQFLDRYASGMKPLLARFNADHGMIGLIGLLIPALIIILLLNLIFSAVGILYLIYGVIILMFCLDARDMKKPLKDYFKAALDGSLVSIQMEAEEFVGHSLRQDKAEISRSVTETILMKALTDIFSVIFWFMLFGPFGAVLYYLTAAITKRAQRPEFGFSDMYSAAEYFKEILDWLPVRFMTLTFSLVGHFRPVFNIWVDRIGGGLLENRQLLIDTGVAAVHSEVGSFESNIDENHQTLHLVSRTLWTWVIIIALLTIASWL